MPVATARLVGHRPRRRPLWTSRQAFFSEVFLFLLGAAGAYSVNIVGALPDSELLLIPVLPILLLLRGRRAFNREYLWFYILAGAWLFGTCVADAYHDIGAFNRVKGLARVIFFIMDFIALAIFLNNRTRRMIIFAMGIAAVLLIGSLGYRDSFNVQWKFGLAQSVAIVALLLSSHFYAKRRYGLCILISLVLAGLNLTFGFRSQLAVLFVSAVLILPLSKPSRNRRVGSSDDQNPYRILLVIALAGGAAYAANATIHYAAEKGFFDESTQAKFETQAQGDYGVLFGGRPETLVAIRAIIDDPIIGHGSFAYGQKYVELRQQIMYQHGYTDTDEPEVLFYPTIPTHSHLTLAWVEGGVLGGICWIYILILTIRAILRLVSLRPNLAPLYCYLLVGFVWDILYSPFGSVNRMLGAYYILLGYLILKSPASAALQVRWKTNKYINGRRPIRMVGASVRPNFR
jgi:hypothetical protein